MVVVVVLKVIGEVEFLGVELEVKVVVVAEIVVEVGNGIAVGVVNLWKPS